MLDDGNAGPEEGCVHGPPAVVRVVDVQGVDADEGGAGFDEMVGGAGREEGVALEVAVGAPMLVPAGVDEDGFAGHVEGGERVATDGAGALGRADDDARQVGEGSQVQLGEVVAFGEAVEGGVQVGARVGHHVDLADVKGSALGVVAARLIAAPVVGDGGGGQAAVGDHAVFDGVAEVDKSGIIHGRLSPRTCAPPSPRPGAGRTLRLIAEREAEPPGPFGVSPIALVNGSN